MFLVQQFVEVVTSLEEMKNAFFPHFLLVLPFDSWENRYIQISFSLARFHIWPAKSSPFKWCLATQYFIQIYLITFGIFTQVLHCLVKFGNPFTILASRKSNDARWFLRACSVSLVIFTLKVWLMTNWWTHFSPFISR